MLRQVVRKHALKGLAAVALLAGISTLRAQDVFQFAVQPPVQVAPAVTLNAGDAYAGTTVATPVQWRRGWYPGGAYGGYGYRYGAYRPYTGYYNRPYSYYGSPYGYGYSPYRYGARPYWGGGYGYRYW